MSKRTQNIPAPQQAEQGVPGYAFSHFLPQLAAMGKGLADINRLRILLALAENRKSVGRVVEELGLSQPLVSHHLKELRQAGLLKVQREGPFVFYEVAGPQVLDALQTLTGLLKGGRR